MANEFDYDALFGGDFGSIAESLDLLPSEVEDMLMGVIDSMAFNVQNFTTSLNQSITQLTANGVSTEVISGTLNQDYKNNGRIFGKLKNDVKGNLAMGASNSGRMGQYDDYTSKDLFAWVTVAGHRICGDCDGMSGQINTYADWEAEGLPGSGWSVCQGYCYCVLDPSGKVSGRVKGAKVKEKARKTEPDFPPGFNPVTRKQAKGPGRKQYNKAKAIEPKITQTIKDVGEKHGAEIHGLKYRLKAENGIIRKMQKESLENNWGVQTTIREDLKDMVRYTYIVDDATYADDVLGMFASFEDEGYILRQVKNYWNGTEYKGMNCVFVEPTTGLSFEVQFNTVSSQLVKDKYSHKLYEQIRVFGISQSEKEYLTDIMIGHWETVTAPNGWELIENMQNFQMYPSGWNPYD